MMGAEVLQFQAPLPQVTPESPLYHPPSFPPPNDWPVSLDGRGNPFSVYGDNYWDFSGFGFYGFNFGHHNLSQENLALVKKATFFVMYHPRLFPGKIASCRGYFLTLVRIAKVCDQQGILIHDLYKFPEVFPLIVNALLGKKSYNRVTQLHNLYLYRDELGFTIANERLLRLLTREATYHEPVQHPYIPLRIWNYQIQRLNEVLDDFIKHQEAIKEAFNSLHQAYLHNLKSVPASYRSPFTEKHLHRAHRVLYEGSFDDFLDRHGLLELFHRWLCSNSYKDGSSHRVTAFSKYLSFVRDTSVIFILNFSLQRMAEATSLKSDCFHTEKDKNLGNICIITGETTKTQNDSDARWIVPELVKKAIDAASEIARLRISALPEDVSLSKEDRENPYLLFPSTELWSPNAKKIRATSDLHGQVISQRSLDYSKLLRQGIKLFDDDKIRITEDDAKEALSLTPNLHELKWFEIGKPWHFTAHQARRTLAINMFASDAVSTSSIQYQMKHLSRQMTLYYGRHHTKLCLNSEAERALILESYNTTYNKLIDIVDDDIGNVKPHGRVPGFDFVIELIDTTEESKLKKLIRDGQVGIRQTLLGFCMKAGTCEYGGIESVAKCAVGDGGGICAHAIFRRKNKDKLIKLKASHKNELSQLSKNSMRAGAIKQEIHAIEVYLDAIDR